MIRKNFWVFITVIAVLLIIIATVSGVYNSLNKKSVTLSAETTTSEQKNNNNDESSESAEPSDEIEESSVPEKYIVQEGDSLWGIAQEFQISVDAIKELNGLTDDGLMLGQELLIPSPGADQSVERTDEDSEALSSRGVDDNGMYSVQEGDSLWSIAARCGTSVAKIKELNNLTGERIVPGMVLQVKGAARSSNQQSDTTNDTTQADRPAAVEPKAKPKAEPKPEPIPEPEPKSSVLDTAKQFVGYSYVRGGSSPSGFDCSGFVSYVYKQHGISLPRTASAQSGVGTKVSSPAPGDLLFFAENGQVIHVAIYAGNGSFIHARNGKYGVCYTSPGDSCYKWYKDRYCGANRI
jgi:peptidoglycan endopeptidase LytE